MEGPGIFSPEERNDHDNEMCLAELMSKEEFLEFDMYINGDDFSDYGNTGQFVADLRWKASEMIKGEPNQSVDESLVEKGETTECQRAVKQLSCTLPVGEFIEIAHIVEYDPREFANEMARKADEMGPPDDDLPDIDLEDWIFPRPSR